MGNLRLAMLAAGLSLCAFSVPSNGAPIAVGAAALKSAAPTSVVDVRWRGRGWGWAGAGFATGLAIGALASRPYYYDYYGPYYAPPYYAPPPVVYAPPAPVYTAPIDPNGPARQCWVATDRDRGYGYYVPC